MVTKKNQFKVSLDSRLINPGEYFVAVKGENFDGHKFIDKALENGAAGVLEEEELFKFAREKLNNINPKIVAITGSLGKSTTRKFIVETLASKYKVAEGDLNTKLGLAVNIMNNIDVDTDYFVAECGMDKKGELAKTGKFLNPEIVVLTNISESHLEKLKSIENIIRAKAELLEKVKSNGKVYLNWDDENVKKTINFSNTKNVIKITSEDLNILPQNINILGNHNLLNLVFACKIALDEGVSKKLIDKKVKNIILPKGRLNLIEGVKGSTIVDDTYNASPKSTFNALEAVSCYHKLHGLDGRKIAVLGGMLELGDYENEGHKEVGKELVNQGFDVVILVGELAKKINHNDQIKNSGIELYYADTSEQAGKLLKSINPTTGDIMLFKASQGIRLEKAIPSVMKNPDKANELLVRQDVRWK